LTSQLRDEESNPNSRLQLKSAETRPDDVRGSHVVICTKDKTYNVRQVSTSNTVFVVQPSAGSSDQISTPGLEAVSQCTSTLELSLDKKSSAVPFIKAILPTFDSGGHRRTEGLSKQQIFTHVPLSDAECQQAWQDLFCFELDDIAFQPSNAARLKTWRSILETANASGIDLTQSLTPGQHYIIINNGEEWPMELIEAILEGLYMDSLEGLDGTKVARFVGAALLRDHTANGRDIISVEHLLAAWADALPEKWRDMATLGGIEGSYQREGNDIIRYVESDAAVGATAAASEDAKTSLGAKRRWHEKLRASKEPS
jgi:sister chromatid cohesion protein DCC1